MKILLVLTAACECIAGLVFLFCPTVLNDLAPFANQELWITRIYGGAALTIGYLAISGLKMTNHQDLKSLLTTLVLFQFLIALACSISFYNGEISTAGGIVLHSAFLLVTIYFLNKLKSQPTIQQSTI